MTEFKKGDRARYTPPVRPAFTWAEAELLDRVIGESHDWDFMTARERGILTRAQIKIQQATSVARDRDVEVVEGVRFSDRERAIEGMALARDLNAFFAEQVKQLKAVRP